MKFMSNIIDEHYKNFTEESLQLKIFQVLTFFIDNPGFFYTIDELKDIMGSWTKIKDDELSMILEELLKNEILVYQHNCEFQINRNNKIVKTFEKSANRICMNLTP